MNFSIHNHKKKPYEKDSPFTHLSLRAPEIIEAIKHAAMIPEFSGQLFTTDRRNVLDTHDNISLVLKDDRFISDQGVRYSIKALRKSNELYLQGVMAFNGLLPERTLMYREKFRTTDVPLLTISRAFRHLRLSVDSVPHVCLGDTAVLKQYGVGEWIKAYEARDLLALREKMLSEAKGCISTRSKVLI